jgi:hypothetical protein
MRVISQPISNEAELAATQKQINLVLDRPNLTADDRDYLKVLGHQIYARGDADAPRVVDSFLAQRSWPARWPLSQSGWRMSCPKQNVLAKSVVVDEIVGQTLAFLGQ